MAFKDVLKELRINRGLTQDDLSKGTGLAKSTISMYENGKFNNVICSIRCICFSL